jgi:ParB family chromosome partitioning protein
MRLLASSATKRSTTQNAESIRQHGLIQPITVRPNSEGFELIAGARRYRAAQLADLFSIPARIVEIDDAQAQEWQLVELSIVVKRFLSAFAVLHVVEMSTTCKFPAYRDLYTQSRQSHAWRSQSRGGAFCPTHLAELAITVEDRLEECIALKASFERPLRIPRLDNR